MDRAAVHILGKAQTAVWLMFIDDTSRIDMVIWNATQHVFLELI